MGQKVNPHGLRVGIIKNWDSRWFVKGPEFGKTLVSDYNLRKFLKKKLFLTGVPKIEIERDNQRARVLIHCAKPGLVIGRGGDEIEKLRPEIENILGKPVSVHIIEVKFPDMNAQLVAEKIAEQLEKRFSFRRAMKQAMAATMKLGAKGIKIAVSGLLGGADIARTEHYHEGTIPLQTIRADIDYGQHAALTKMGLIGIKVWIYKGEVLTKVNRDAKSEADRSRVGESIPQRRERRHDRSDRDGDDKGERSDRPPYQQRDNRGGDRRPQGQGGGGRGRFNNTPAAPPSNFGNRKSFGQKTARPVRSADDEVPEAPRDDSSKGGNGDVNA
ncbi:MAG: 30S ribosomal protein S3 [Oscillospiraceae bacterium]|nr:30S ribosomal protein S3 [Oscillospiraceae bacterium]